jgi:hypothetical protein
MAREKRAKLMKMVLEMSYDLKIEVHMRALEKFFCKINFWLSTEKEPR